ncbi:hypothetical protein [Pontibacter fetidus]|uniref:Glycosyltransferase RgtA/B/C/D-like domain-containing protein n=1 Tax=Pontibacter fetidus TaxID=2700082 RepID=A0A6B2GYG5_9BACT|nr:hypothetical protein [Pontibacter fetidus]NDK54908.1 hypothetical protein [Pontibacter fetidus]
MVSYFRSVRLSRLSSLVFLFLAIQLPLYLLLTSGTVQELLYMLIGERMADGYTMYQQIYDNTAPLSAMVYWLIDLITGRSVLAYRIVALTLVLVQALTFNFILNRHQVFATRTYIPALLYLVLGSITYEFGMLTPLLIGHTFVILSLPYLITVSREGIESNRLFVGGFILGLAALCYLPLGLYLAVGVFAVLLFASNTFRSILLMLCGFLFPYAVLLTFYFYTGTLDEFATMHLLRPWQFKVALALPPADLAKLMALPLIVLLFAVLSSLSLPQRLVFQVKFQQVMWIWLLVSIILIITRDEISANTFLLLLPAIAYFGEYLFSISVKKWMLSVAFVLLLVGTLLIRYRDLFGISNLLQLSDSQLLTETSLPEAPKGQSVLVLGNQTKYYLQNKPATPYLNWQLAQQDFGNLNEYDAVYNIYLNLKVEMPAYIIDEAGLMKELKYKIPAVFGRYNPTAQPNIYELKQ